MDSWKKRWIGTPHPLVVFVIFLASVGLLWQAADGEHNRQTETLGTLVTGEVVKVVSETDTLPQPGTRSTRSQLLLVRIDPDREVRVINDLMPLEPGNHVYLNESFPGTPDESYTIVDYRRTYGLLGLFGLFAAAVLAVSGFRKGLYALVGLVFSLAVIFAYVIPAILNGSDPVFIGLLAASLILVGTFYVSYGLNRKSLSALIGIGITLALVGFIGKATVRNLHFSGFSDEASVYLNAQTNMAVSLVDLVIAGIIIAAIGVLDDVAITQSSTVFELGRGGARGWELFRRAMRIGRDHISAVINTLVLAYAGAALPLILLLYVSDFPLGFTVGGEPVAEEIVRTLVSSLGLVLAVPLTTAVAVFLGDRLPLPQGNRRTDAHAHTEA